MAKTKHILVIRFSSMGDIALTIPVLQAVLAQNDNLKITVLTKKPFHQIFALLPNLNVITGDFKQQHKSFFGVLRLFFELKKQYDFDLVIDLHHVLRSMILSRLFRILGIPVFYIDKGRSNKKKYTKLNHPRINRLKHTTERYADVFRKAGFEANLNLIEPIKILSTQKVNSFLDDKKDFIIGIAPFAAHEAKQYPLEKMKKIIAQLQKENCTVLIFGGGKREKTLANQLAETFENVNSVIGQFSLNEELALMQACQVMLTMDSSNMHLARLVGTKVLSIWGSTHPYIGFAPFQETDEATMIQVPIEELPCRPCSVYGNKPCHRGDFACMNRVEERTVVKKIFDFNI